MLRPVLTVMLIAHAAVSAVALKDAGVLSVFPPFKDDFVYQIFSDVAAANGLVLFLCYLQLKKKGRPLRGLWAALVGSALLGTFSPLIYLWIEKDLFDDASRAGAAGVSR